MITEPQIRKIYTLLGQHDLRDEKDGIVLAFTANKTNSVRAMSFHEAKALIGHLVSLNPEEKSMTKMRNKIISIAYDMNWKLPNEKIDLDRLNGWCLHKSYLKKKLDAYKYSELPKLVTQFEEVLKSYLDV